jgi:hypothetical protein
MPPPVIFQVYAINARYVLASAAWLKGGFEYGDCQMYFPPEAVANSLPSESL